MVWLPIANTKMRPCTLVSGPTCHPSIALLSQEEMDYCTTTLTAQQRLTAAASHGAATKHGPSAAPLAVSHYMFSMLAVYHTRSVHVHSARHLRLTLSTFAFLAMALQVSTTRGVSMLVWTHYIYGTSLGPDYLTICSQVDSPTAAMMSLSSILPVSNMLDQFANPWQTLYQRTPHGTSQLMTTCWGH